MSTAELKYNLIHEIDQITDDSKLMAIYNVLMNNKSTSVVELSEDEKTAVRKAQKQFSDGQTHSHSSVMEEAKNRFSFLK